MTFSLRHFSHIAATMVLVLFAAPAFAGTMMFAETLTSNQSWFGSNLRGTLEAGDLSGKAGDIMLNGNVTKGAGIGDGYVNGSSDFVLFTHTFSPSEAVASVTSAHLIIFVRDDGFDGRESAKIELNGEAFDKGSVGWFTFFGGDIGALFENGEDGLTVAILGRRGDFHVDHSTAVWTYETDDSGGPSTGTGSQPVPEPTGLALFCVGAVVLRKATRRPS